jgi:hypothetical protein
MDLRFNDTFITLPRPMKAQRRHELKTNTLAESLRDLPELARRWGSTALLAVVVVALAIVLLRIRANNTAQKRTVDAQSLQTARGQINQIQGLYIDLARDANPSQNDVEEIKSLRDQFISDALSELQSVQRDSSADDVTLAAELEAEGDLYLTLAQAPDLPGSDEDPSLKLNRSPEQYLKDATSSYQQILDKYPTQKLSAQNARFGLATIAEDQGLWDVAGSKYQEIIDESASSPAVKKQAQGDLDGLDALKSVVYLSPTPRDTNFGYLMQSMDPPAWLKAPTTAPSSSTTKPAHTSP